jgi:hypothetical protein
VTRVAKSGGLKRVNTNHDGNGICLIAEVGGGCALRDVNRGIAKECCCSHEGSFWLVAPYGYGNG